jgi:hypothetical protein
VRYLGRGSYELVSVLASIIVLVLFFGRRKAVVWWIISFEAFGCLFATFELVINILTHHSIVPVFIGYAEITLIIIYFIRSKRVRETFILKARTELVREIHSEVV